ncbi:MAG: FAD-binding oxidoreductase, partial [Pleurocapsa sp. SU_196_0]|nr:FAD-binding oxidoreductase [Pleurocapsa sp. SU_196_0]
MIEVNAEDQYAIVSGDVTLNDLEAALPDGLQFRAPRLGLTLEDWLLSGGVGLLNTAPIRSDVLGLTYAGTHGSVSIGGVVVKNVSGYDLRFVIGSDPSLQKPVRLERAVLRLRPSANVTRLEQSASESELDSCFASLQRL